MNETNVYIYAHEYTREMQEEEDSVGYFFSFILHLLLLWCRLAHRRRRHPSRLSWKDIDGVQLDVEPQLRFREDKASPRHYGLPSRGRSVLDLLAHVPRACQH